MRKQFWHPIVLLLMSLSVFAQQDKEQMLHYFIERTMSATEIVPSISMVVVNDKDVLYQSTLGYANWEKHSPATPQTRYYIASCTKAFNGLLAHILAAEGKIDLNAPILQYRPFKDFEQKEVFEEITVMDLISHQSGIDNPYLTFRLAYSGDYTHDEILRLIEHESWQNEKGKAFEYSNFGYYLLDYLMQSELGKSWKDLLKEKVFDPLSMDGSTAYASAVPKGKQALPHTGLFKDEVKIVPLQKNDDVMHAAGGLMMTTKDAARFLQFYLDGGKGIYLKSVVEESIRPEVETAHEFVRVFKGTGYASGWRTGKFEGEKIVYHFGGYAGYFAHFSFLPEKNLGMAIFVNSDMGMVPANLISKYAYNLFLGNAKQLKQAEKLRAKKIPKALSVQRKAQQAHQKKLSERTWNLSLPKEKYTGLFLSENYGKVEVLLQENEFIVRAGNLKTVATPFPSEDSMRVELVPGSGTIIGFDIKDGEIVSLYHQRETFIKVEQ